MLKKTPQALPHIQADDMHNPPPTLWLFALPLMAGVLAALVLLPVTALGPVWLLFTVCGLTCLAYVYLLPVALLKRRALLARITTESSALRRFLWDSLLVRLALVATSAGAAALVLIMTAGLGELEVCVLGGSLLSFLVLYRFCERAFADQLNTEYRFHFILRIANRTNLVVMTLALVAVQVLWLEVEDTRHLLLPEVIRKAFTEPAETANLAAVGWLVGLNSAVSASLWHLMQLSSQSDIALPLRLLAWLGFLIFNAVKLGAVWTVLLGVPSGLYQCRRAARVPEPQYRRRLIVGVTIVALIGSGAFLLSTRSGLVPFVKSLPTRWQHALTEAPCANRSHGEQQELATEARKNLNDQQRQLIATMDSEIDRGLDRAFASAEVGIDRFLDWNFSLTGQYSQLLMLSRSMLSERSFTQQLGERIDRHLDPLLSPELAHLQDRLASQLGDALNRITQSQDAYLTHLVESADCVRFEKPSLPLSAAVNKSLVGTGLAVGPVAAFTGGIALRATTRAAGGAGSRALTKPASKRVASQMFARLSTRATAGTASGSVGALCGPFIVACGSAFALVTWIGMDLTINQIDEALNRERMRDDLLAVLNEQKRELRAQLREGFHRRAGMAFEAMEQYQNQTFNVRRDALGVGAAAPEQG